MAVKTWSPEDLKARYDQGMRQEQTEHDGTEFNEQPVSVKGHGWLLRFLNHSPEMFIESKTKYNDDFIFFYGNSISEINVPNYQEVWYHNVYDNIDVRYYSSAEGNLEYDIICKPGFNREKIALEFDGIEKITKNSEGELALATSVGDMILPPPITYQKIKGEKNIIPSSYHIEGKNIISFELGNFDESATLIIDPIALRWATWINNASSQDNHGHCIWVDPSDGAIYIANRAAGTTNNITLGAFDETYNGGVETVVGKYIEPTTIGGSGIRVWQTYIGGNDSDNPYAMEQGPDGNLYIAGVTSSPDFPLLGGSAFSGSSIDNRNEGSNNIFVLKINQSGNSVKSAVFGGNRSDNSLDLRIAPSGDIFVVGRTNSDNLATLYPNSGATDSIVGSNDVLLLKLNQDLSSVLWIKNYGGSNDDQATIMKLNTVNGDIFIAGFTSSSNFPLLNAREPLLSGQRSGFIQKLKQNGSLVWSSYFNSDSSRTSILCMEFNTEQNRLFFGGITNGLNANNISLSGVFDNTYNGGQNDFFIAAMDTNQTLVASTYIGGLSNEGNMMGLNLDLNNDVYVFGYSNSNNFPVTADALQSINMGSNDKVFLKLSSTLGSLIYSTYYGGTQDDYDPVGERGIKFSNCRIYTLVTARSANIPLTQGAINTTKNSFNNVYEPGLVVWANPPDLSTNTLQGNQQLCSGQTPGNITGSAPSYLLPAISRNDTLSAYPSSGFSTISYQWQLSTDSINWTDIVGATGQNLSGSMVGPLFQRTFFRRVIGGDACVITGETNQIIVANIFSINATVNNASCFDFNNGSITAQIANGVPPFIYSWSNGATGSSISDLLPGTYSVTVTDALNCTNSANYTVTQPAPLSVNTSVSGTTCVSNEGTITSIVSGGTEPYSYLWSNGVTSDSLAITVAGIYALTVTDNNGCEKTDSVNVNTFAVTTLPDQKICLGDSVQLQVSGGVSYLWTPATAINNPTIANPRVSPDVNTTYSVLVTDENGCEAVAELMVEVLEMPNVDFSAHYLPSCNGMIGKFTNNSLGAERFLWVFENGDTATTENTSHNFNTGPGTLVTLIAYTSDGCADTAITDFNNTIYSNTDFELLVPNIITPNADDLNECFRPDFKGEFNKCFTLKIYNRWGALIFESIAQGHCWDGTNKAGNPVESGTYFYLLDINGIQKNGFLTVAHD